jgi:Putative restriction endonuclease
MGTTTYIPVEVYLRSSYEPDAEYVDGEIERRPAGELDHASWQHAIATWFWQHEDEWRIGALPSLRVQVAATRYRVPDVTVLDRNQPTEQIITHPPLAVFEVLSPEDSLQRLKRNSKTTGQWVSPKFGSSIPRTTPFIDMKTCSSCATTPSPTPTRGSRLT